MLRHLKPPTRTGNQRRRSCVFVSSWGARLGHNTVHTAFDQIRRAAGVSGSRPGHWPRLHDLRHTFAVKTLLGWYRNGDDVAARLPQLSAYLGRVDPAATYWYLSAAPELLGLAADRLEHSRHGDGARDDAVLMAIGECGRRQRAARARRAAR